MMIFSEHPKIALGRPTILIGANGSGKSSYLRELVFRFLGDGQSVIAIAPTIHDRFRGIRRDRFNFFGARLGTSASKKAVGCALERTRRKGLAAFENLLRALEYTKFDPVVGVRIKRIRMENLRAVTESGMPLDEVRELEAALYSWEKRQQRSKRDAVQLSLRYHSFDELESLSFAAIARNEGRLKRLKVISGIEYFLLRQGEEISLLDACSGELSLICSLGFIAANLDRNSVIIVDEPENSLHPTWQKDYLKMLLDLFHHFRPTIVIATHSPIVISGASVEKEEIVVFEVKEGRFERFSHVDLNLEEMYERLFDLVTPKNHYLSRRAVELLDGVNQGEIGAEEATKVLNEFRSKSYDEAQIEVIDGISELASRVEKIRIGND